MGGVISRGGGGGGDNNNYVDNVSIQYKSFVNDVSQLRVGPRPHSTPLIDTPPPTNITIKK